MHVAGVGIHHILVEWQSPVISDKCHSPIIEFEMESLPVSDDTEKPGVCVSILFVYAMYT